MAAYMVDKDGALHGTRHSVSDARSKGYIKKWLTDGTFDSVFPQIPEQTLQDRQARLLPGLRTTNQKSSTKQLTSEASKIISVIY